MLETDTVIVYARTTKAVKLRVRIIIMIIIIVIAVVSTTIVPLKKFNFTKKNPKKLIKFHEYPLDEIQEIKRAQEYINFWECKLIFKTREWRPAAENLELYSKQFSFSC